ncbi:MAG: Jag N-terminal domain-containing protein [Clostridia bacterium]|nr:Jag N-terminal domain-containing protein [Clostridia bacterium]
MQNMNETYLIMAKTVEEAIAIANREYAKDGKEVSYEILEMPKKGFLGIGARDAKIKITVSESESSKIGSELSSIVADLRGMKVHTNRGGSEGEDKPKKQQNPQGQKKQAQPAQGQKPGQKPAEKSEKQSQKPQGQAPKQGQVQKPAQGQKPAAPKQDAKPAESKQQKPAEAKKTQGQAQPKHESQPKAEAKAQKPQESKAEPKPERQPKADVKPEKTVEAKKPQEPKERREPKEPKPQAAEPVKEPVVPTVPVVAEPAAPVVSESAEATAAEPAKNEYKSNLRNQAKPQRRQKAPKSQNADAVPGAEAIIAAPVGLADFTREAGAESFGSASASTGRMSNDIRKKQRQPKRADKPAEPKEETVLSAVSESVPAELDAVPADAAEVITEQLETMEPAAEVPAVEEDRQKVGVTEAEMQYALDFTNTLLRNMAIDATAERVECPEGEEYVIEGDANVYPKINIDGSGTGILIGHHGETLDAVQYLVNLAALRQSKQKGGDYVKIVVDIENYRAKREETLRSLARRMAARAVKYKRNVFLEPMNAYERRIIHSELHSFENVSTHSVGADKNRKIIITYEGPDKAPQQPRKEKEERADRSERGEKREGKQESKGSASRRGEKENRRPKKIQKMPIEKLPDFLANGTTEDNDTFVEIED